ncbi:peptidoglycan editing factor PgeF [Parahaliea mediterranea]|uniref:Purine nucleoside phosphorylase n=1 Tax=Parahaliea mediterranea TaxID=651086 RepID=A0A939IKS2_9GAMM|nr:peptidoglycan editing factor PgeF [Parahaliea mediterranea]MBN7795228.1 peptidoglycan editing factor PgeF [Parahaliea mediterranea]
MPVPPALIEADWPAPPGVRAFCTTRRGGCGAPPFDSFNLGHHVGDPACAQNRRCLQALLPGGARLQWLQQVHGTAVVEVPSRVFTPEADASWTRTRGAACAVLTADCLPVLFCDRGGTRVAAAHAGWRGLAAGVLEATVSAIGVAPAELLAWLGPAIGPRAFEVGPEVRAAFCAGADDAEAACFEPSGRPGHYFADLYALARLRLARAGLTAVHGGGHCTFSDAEHFFSYRRDGNTGRMASIVTLAP